MASERALLASGVRIALGLMPELTNVKRAARLGVTTRTLYEWKNGALSPSPENIARLANASGMTEDDIRNGRLPAGEAR